MYKSDEELFSEVMEEAGLSKHPRYMEISACVSTLVSLRVGPLDGMSHEDVMLLAAKCGFRFSEHSDVRVVVEAVERWHDKRREFDQDARRAPFRSFDAHFFRDRNGRLMATFSMGTTTFRPIVLDETWEQKFASIYQDTLVAALRMGASANGVHHAEDGHSGEPDDE